VGRPGVPWDDTLVGRFFAVNKPEEYYEAGETTAQSLPVGRRTYRWWRITAVEPRRDGHVNLFVETVWWGHYERGGPTLFRWENYTSGTSPVELDYIIAPGSWVSDVRRAVAGDKPGLVGQATAEDPRTIVLTPSASPDPLFSRGDPITNPPGASPWHPVAFRARHYENYPGLMPGYSFVSSNWGGKVALGAGLLIQGPAYSIEKIRANQKDGGLPYGAGVEVFAACRAAISVRGPAENGIVFWQPDGSPHKILWFWYRETTPGKKVTESSALHVDPNTGDFVFEGGNLVWQPVGSPHKILWSMKGGAAASALHADPNTGDFVFEGGNLDYQDHGGVKLRGLSATAKPANNLRGIGVTVKQGLTTKQVVFATAESDNMYAVMVECSWLTLKAVEDKKTTGFTVSFSVAAPVGATLDWLLLR
jgi:hypothetical protein